jgi:hypothetical protein
MSDRAASTPLDADMHFQSEAEGVEEMTDIVPEINISRVYLP